MRSLGTKRPDGVSTRMDGGAYGYVGGKVIVPRYWPPV